MLTPQFTLGLAHELVVDLFAGGGGASTGIEQAIGRHVDVAVNHDPEAVSLHQANHPQTDHHVCDVFEVDPVTVCDGRPLGLLWASPDCKHFSKAKGGKPVSKNIRGLAWVVVKWAKLAKPRIIHLENVEEFQTWGPLLPNGRVCPDRKGRTFRTWKRSLERLGYVVEHRELRACDYGAPTIRKRLFLTARRDGVPISWPAPTHGPGRLPYLTAASCIDWSIPCPSIFERDRPLVDATLRRIAHGLKRFVIDAARPFIVPVTHQGDSRVHSIDEPLRTITSAKRGELALSVPTLATIGYGEREGQAPRVQDLQKPLGTIVGAKKHALVTAFLAKHFGDRGQRPGSGMDEPVSTVTTSDHNALVAATIVKHNFGEHPAHAVDSPLHTVTTQANKHSVVTAQLVGCGGRAGQSRPRSSGEPVQTITAKADTALVASTLAKLRGTSSSAATDEPLHTISAGGQHHAEVRALLIKYYGTDQDPRLDEPLHTVTTKDRFGLVTVEGTQYEIADIGMRMLQPRELYRAQGFSDSYVIDRGADGRVLSKAAQVRMCGNSVVPAMARAIVAANWFDVGLRVAA